MLKKSKYVLLVKMTVGRGTVLNYPISSSRINNIVTVEKQRNNHGALIDAIPAIKKFNVYYRVIVLPDGTMKEGSIFFDRTYEEIPASEEVVRGMATVLDRIDRQTQLLIFDFGLPVEEIQKKLKHMI